MEDGLFFETGNSYISAVDSVITTKFGLLIDMDLAPEEKNVSQSETASKSAPQRPPSLKST